MSKSLNALVHEATRRRSGVGQPVRDITNRVGARLTEQLRRVRADATLSDEGKKIAAARAYLAARDELRTWREQQDTAIRAELSSARRRVFTPAVGLANDPGSVVSRRDAADRAERLENADAAGRLLARAIDQQDDDLARAVLRAAWEQRWDDVVDSFARSRPGEAEALQRLADAENAGFTQEESILLSGFARPAELGHDDPEQVVRDADRAAAADSGTASA